MFSQVSVILSLGDGMMSLPVWLPGRMFGDCLAVSVQRGLCPEGGVSVHPKSEKANGMHPTGILSCLA